MAKMQRDIAKERRWREVLGRQSTSGLSVRAFCLREGLKEASFFAWRRTLRERDGESSAFVPVVVSDSQVGERLIAVELAGGHTLKLSSSTPATWLADLLHALEATR